MQRRRRPNFGNAITLTAVWVAVLLAGGCSHQPTTEARIQAALVTGQTLDPVYPLAGTILIDGQPPPPPKNSRRLMMSLYDSAALANGPVAVTACKPDGAFAFQTVREGDGIATGSYVVTFGYLAANRRPGSRNADRLKDRYRDPVANARKPEFLIDHHAPGKRDYQFDLKTSP